MRIEKGSDITKNVKIIEWIKNEILISVSDLFNLIFKGVKPIDDKLQNTLLEHNNVNISTGEKIRY